MTQKRHKDNREHLHIKAHASVYITDKNMSCNINVHTPQVTNDRLTNAGNWQY